MTVHQEVTSDDLCLLNAQKRVKCEMDPKYERDINFLGVKYI